MEELSFLLIALGASGIFIGWNLYQRTLSKMIEHIKINHYEIWLNLNCPMGKSPPDPLMSHPQMRKFILNKDYEGYSDLFLKEIGDVVRQRLLFSFFCFICLLAGIVLFILNAI